MEQPVEISRVTTVRNFAKCTQFCFKFMRQRVRKPPRIGKSEALISKVWKIRKDFPNLGSEHRKRGPRKCGAETQGIGKNTGLELNVWNR